MALTVHVRDLGFPEGPVALPDGRIAFVDLLHQAVLVYDGRSLEVIARLAGSPNGMRLAPDGAFIVANNGGIAPVSLTELWHADPEITGRIQRIELDGAVRDLAIDLPGAPPWRPNDLAIAPGGGIVYTDPHNWEVLPDETAYGGGRVGLVRPDGSVKLLAEVPAFPNGVCFGPDGDLYVAQTIAHRILRFTWASADALDEPRVFAELPAHINPDGMVWHDDRLIVAGSVGDEVVVLDPQGALVARFPTGPGSDPTNVCVAGDELWITLGLPGQLVSVPLAKLGR
jgi:sugar lactone lactonase YvrE